MLYATNALRITDPPLTVDLPRFIIPQRLATVRRIQLVYRIPIMDPVVMASVTPAAGSAKDQLQHLRPDVFPALRELYLAFWSSISPGPQTPAPLDWVQHCMLRPVDDIVVAFGAQATHVEIAPRPDRTFAELRKDLRRVTGGGERLGGRLQDHDCRWAYRRAVPDSDGRGYWVSFQMM